jgi:CRP-like cAMP-binding protein
MTDMTTDDKRDTLRRIDFFAGCNDRQLLDIARMTGERTVETGQELCRQHEVEAEVYVIVDGDAVVTVDGADVGKTRIGEIVGELSMLSVGRRAATIRATSQLRVLVLDPEEIDSVLAADPSSSRKLSQHGDPS